MSTFPKGFYLLDDKNVDILRENTDIFSKNVGILLKKMTSKAGRYETINVSNVPTSEEFYIGVGNGSQSWSIITPYLDTQDV